MKKNKLGVKIGLGLLIIVIIALIGVIIWGITSGNGFTFFEEPVVIYDNAFEGLESINVDAASYDVEIKESKPLLQNSSAVYDMKNVYDCSNARKIKINLMSKKKTEI